jgi:hypothetical protein
MMQASASYSKAFGIINECSLPSYTNIGIVYNTAMEGSLKYKQEPIKKVNLHTIKNTPQDCTYHPSFLHKNYFKGYCLLE